MAKFAVLINSFDGGLNTKVSPLHGDPSESPDLQNVEFDDFGAVSTRKGYAKINTVGTGELDFLHSFRYTGGSKLIGSYGNVYELSGTTLVVVSGSTEVFTGGQKVAVVNTLNYLFMTDSQVAYKYSHDGYFTLWGVSTLTTAFMTSIASGNSTLAGDSAGVDYAYRIAFITSMNVEGPACQPKTFAVSSTCSPVRVSFDSIPALYGINYLALYRNDYLLDVITAGTSYYDDTHEILTTSRDETIDDGRPPSMDILCYHKGRCFGSKNDTTSLYYTEVDTPEDWDADNYIRVGNDDGFTIRALAIYNDGLIIAKDDGYGNGNIYVLYMPDNDPDNWTLELLNLSYGGIAPGAICRFGNFLAVLNRNGLYDLSTVSMGIIDSKPISWKIEPDFDNFVNTYLNEAVAVNYKNKIWLSIPSGIGNENNIVYQYDFIRGIDDTTYGAWSKFVSDIVFKFFCVHQGTLYGMDYDGFIYNVVSDDYNDDSSAIDCYYRTMHIHGEDEHRDNTKIWRYIYITYSCLGDWNITITWRGEYSVNDDGTYSLNLYSGVGAQFGTAIFGTSVFNTSQSQNTIKIPISLVSRTIQVAFSVNTADNYFKIHSIGLHYNLRGLR